MFSRRELLLGVPAAAAARELSADDLRPIAGALTALRHLTPSADVDTIKDRQKTHFKVNQKFPNYLDLGFAVWDRMYTWHLENHLPLNVKRSADGHMEMEFMFTALVLKWDMAEGTIGVPYD